MRAVKRSERVAVFLVADTQLYKRLCPSVRWLVGRSVNTRDPDPEPDLEPDAVDAVIMQGRGRGGDQSYQS